MRPEPRKVGVGVQGIHVVKAQLDGRGKLVGGPLVVALFTDRVFGSPELVRYSLMVAPSALLLIGAALISMGFKGLREFRS